MSDYTCFSRRVTQMQNKSRRSSNIWQLTDRMTDEASFNCQDKSSLYSEMLYRRCQSKRNTKILRENWNPSLETSRLEMNSTDYLHTWCVVIQERTDKNNKPSILSSGDVSVSHEGFSGSRYLVPVYRNKHSTAEQLFPAQSELQCFILYLRTPLKYNTCVNLLRYIQSKHI